jgi:hypothetical protein
LTIAAVDIVIGGTAVRIAVTDENFRHLLLDHYGDFIGETESADPIELMIDLTPSSAIDEIDAEDDLQVVNESGIWILRRGDFRARYDPDRRCGVVRQGANRYSIDAVLRIVHSIDLAGEGGFLLHAASAIRDGRAFIFAGRSGAGKTTIARLAPAGVSLLSDEISWVRPSAERFVAWGTPFTGELGQPGVNRSAPVGALYFLEQARENRITRLEGAEAVRLLLENILFFADDPRLVRRVFDNACAFAESTSIFRLSFLPDSSAWELIR